MHELTLNEIVDLSDQELKEELGVKLLGHRKRILADIRRRKDQPQHEQQKLTFSSMSCDL